MQKLGNINAVTTGRIIEPVNLFGIKVCTLPREIQKFMIANKVKKIIVNEWGFKTEYTISKNSDMAISKNL